MIRPNDTYRKILKWCDKWLVTLIVIFLLIASFFACSSCSSTKKSLSGKSAFSGQSHVEYAYDTVHVVTEVLAFDTTRLTTHSFVRTETVYDTIGHVVRVITTEDVSTAEQRAVYLQARLDSLLAVMDAISASEVKADEDFTDDERSEPAGSSTVHAFLLGTILALIFALLAYVRLR